MRSSSLHLTATGFARVAILLAVPWGGDLQNPAAAATNLFAAEVIAAQGPFGPAPYDDPAAVLGPPATDFYDPLGAWSGGSTVRRVKLVEGAYHLDPTQTRKLLTTLREGSVLVVRFAQPIQDDPAHPYGLDFLVFGNTAYVCQGFVDDASDMNTLLLAGGDLAEPMKVSVSPGYTGQPGQSPTDWRTWDWYRYEHGPYADTAFPTHAYRWDRARAAWTQERMDFSKPVNPALGALLGAEAGPALTAAEAIELYDGSGGGTGFDLAESGFASIEYLKVEGLPGLADGEVDAFAAVRPMVLGDSLTIAPANLSQSNACLRFQHPARPTDPALALCFTALSSLARVTTAPVLVPSVVAEAGQVLTAARLELEPLLHHQPVSFAATLHVFAGPAGQGNGGDLVLLRLADGEWERAAFVFDSATSSVEIGVTNQLPTLALVRIRPPCLSLQVGAGGSSGPPVTLRFAALPGWTYTVERTRDFRAWEPRGSLTPRVPQVAAVPDTEVTGSVFYRLRLNRQ